MLESTDRHGSYFFEPTAEGDCPDQPVPLSPEELRHHPIVLIRSTKAGEVFEVATQLGFHHGPTKINVVVPGREHHLESDLTSTPDLFTWLVPKTGAYLPAALIHDGLIYGKDQPPTYTSAHVVDRQLADLMFRDAMAVLGVRRARRWVIWTAVTVATAVTGGLTTTGRLWQKGKRTWQIIVAATFLSLIALGTLATVDLFLARPLLPWMRADQLWLQLLSGAGVAVAVPTALALLLWHPVRRAGVIAGVTLALLLHVTAALAVLTLAFRLADDPKVLWKDTKKLLLKVFHAQGSTGWTVPAAVTPVPDGTVPNSTVQGGALARPGVPPAADQTDAKPAKPPLRTP
ncbi:MAG: DUF1353 domain-containing protein [Acidimicrobiales bacterium]